MEKIRSGPSFLYRRAGLNCTVIDVRLKKKVRGAILTQALLEAIKRYPYLASKLVEKNGDFYIADNRNLSLTVRRTEEFRPLGSMANSYHLIEVSYYKEHIRVSFHHALCDGGGIKPFVETLLYDYFCMLNHRNYAAPNVRKSGDPLFPDETAEPFEKPYVVGDYEEPIVVKDGFALPEYENQMEDEDYRFEIEADAEDYLAFARRVNATPAILLAYLVSKAICLSNPDMDKPVVCSMAADMRRELGLPHTHKNCVRSMYLPFERENAAREPREVCTRYRASIAQQRQVEYVKQTANSFLGMNDRLDQLKTLEEKKAMMSFFDTMTVNSYVLSYLGAFDLGECDPFIDAIHFYSGGIRGITVNMTHAGGRFNITFIQNIETERYAETLLRLLEKCGLRCRLNSKVRFSTTRDQTQKTGRRQSERFQIR
nr:hypothetical protein [uncultured Oscillibacter sp.]